MKAVVAAFNQEKDLVGAFSVITNLRMELFGALVVTSGGSGEQQSSSRRQLNAVLELTRNLHSPTALLLSLGGMRSS